ncbi:MAG TPA: sulfite exporter TauE/SafE family protein [Streptosporangiaceae bacterium]|nr:sulfite exporter TauE/SafE family protein [Streptosporangiaceae bacterium]
MSSVAALAIFAASVAAGAINAVVGSGSLITFPTLLALGYPPVVANVSNNIGMVGGNFSAVFGYSEELHGQRPRLLRLCAASLAGSLAGAIALLALPAGVFNLVVPALIIAGCVLVLIQPSLSAWVAGRGGERSDSGGLVLVAGVFLTGVYGGYFGAAQGVILIGLLGVFWTDGLQRVNAAKNVLVTVVNGTAALVFAVFAHVAWSIVPVIVVGAAVGGLIGAKVGRRLPPLALRVVVVLIGIISAIKLIFFS